MKRTEEIWQWHAIAHGPISVTTASAAFLQFDWKLLRQFPIMRCMWLLASVVTFQSYSILSGRVAFLQFSWKLPCQFPITVECLTQAASVAISQSYSISSGTGCISSILLKVAMPVSDYGKMLDTSSFCCNVSILFNFKWHGLHFFNSLESCHASFRLR